MQTTHVVLEAVGSSPSTETPIVLLETELARSRNEFREFAKKRHSIEFVESSLEVTTEDHKILQQAQSGAFDKEKVHMYMQELESRTAKKKATLATVRKLSKIAKEHSKEFAKTVQPCLLHMNRKCTTKGARLALSNLLAASSSTHPEVQQALVELLHSAHTADQITALSAATHVKKASPTLMQQAMHLTLSKADPVRQLALVSLGHMVSLDPEGELQKQLLTSVLGSQVHSTEEMLTFVQNAQPSGVLIFMLDFPT